MQGVSLDFKKLIICELIILIFAKFMSFKKAHIWFCFFLVFFDNQKIFFWFHLVFFDKENEKYFLLFSQTFQKNKIS